jgi:hypothetical protein
MDRAMQHVTGLVRQRTETEILFDRLGCLSGFRTRRAGRPDRDLGLVPHLRPPRRACEPPKRGGGGETWFDLSADALRRACDPPRAVPTSIRWRSPRSHRGTWSSLRKRWRRPRRRAHGGRRSGPWPRLHPASPASPCRAAVCWPQATFCVSRTARWLNALAPTASRGALDEMPACANPSASATTGTVRPRRWGCRGCSRRRITRSSRSSTGVGSTSAGSTSTSGAGTRPSTTAPARRPGRTSSFLVEGPVVAEAQAHLECFLEVVEGLA